MDASDKEALFKLSDQLGGMLTCDTDKLLDELQTILFRDMSLDCVGALDRVGELLCDECFHTKVSKVERSAAIRQTEHKLLVLEVVAHLGDIFLSVASGKEPNLKVIKQLDQFLLPRLFLTTSVNSELLCNVALKSPLQFLNNAFRKDPEVGNIMHGLEAVLVSWKINYGCDFLLSQPTFSKESAEPPSAPLLRNVDNSSPVGKTPQHPRRTAAACTVWDANSYSRQFSHGSSLHSARRMPACLLSKRRQNFSVKRYSEVSSSSLGKSVDEPLPLGSKREFSLSNMLSDSEDNDSLAGFETPVKRRKTDPSLFVPPSPDRTNRY